MERRDEMFDTMKHHFGGDKDFENKMGMSILLGNQEGYQAKETENKMGMSTILLGIKRRTRPRCASFKKR
jgi:hypothetical protein